MPTFDYSFTVDAPLSAVSDFHHGSEVLQKLSPPPIFVRLHRADPLSEGAEAEFTMWFGPVPVRWRALHFDVSERGFTDVQIRGPLKHWQHSHRFTPLADGRTRVDENIEYEHDAGLRGAFTRLFFNGPALRMLFTYRRLVTRWSLAGDTGRARMAAGGLVAGAAAYFLARELTD